MVQATDVPRDRPPTGMGELVRNGDGLARLAQMARTGIQTSPQLSTSVH